MNKLRRGGQPADVGTQQDQAAVEDSFFWKSQQNISQRNTVNEGVSSASNNYKRVNSSAELASEPVPQKTLFKGICVGILSFAGSATAMLSMILYPSPMVAIAGSVSTVVAGTVAYKEYKLMSQPTLRGEVNKMRGIVNSLKGGVDELSEQIDELNDVNDRLKPIETAMSAIALKQGSNVRDMVDLVKQNGIQLEKLKNILLEISIEEIIKIFLQSDWNRNFRIDNYQEIQYVSMRVEIKLTSLGIQFNKIKFEEEIKKHSDIVTIIQNLRDIIVSEDDPDQQILCCESSSLSKMTKAFSK